MQWHRKRHLSLDTFHKSHARTSKHVKGVLLRLLSPLLQLLPHALYQCLQQHITKRVTSRHTPFRTCAGAGLPSTRASAMGERPGEPRPCSNSSVSKNGTWRAAAAAAHYLALNPRSPCAKNICKSCRQCSALPPLLQAVTALEHTAKGSDLKDVYHEHDEDGASAMQGVEYGGHDCCFS